VRWSDRASNWIAGFGLGGIIGILGGGLPVFGLVLAAAFLVPALRSRAPIAAVAGLLVGAAGFWLLLVGRATLACSAFDAGPGQECSGPDLGAWVVGASLLLVAGLALTVREWRRR
jgi:hypothetical protein